MSTNYLKNFINYCKGWRGFTLIAYMWLILMAYVIVYVDVISVEMKKRFYIVSVAEVILIALIYLCPKLLKWAEEVNISYSDLTRSDKIKFFLHSWLYIFAVFFVLYIIFFPGGFNADAISQYSQAVGLSNYNDWHPVFNTLFSYTLPLKLTGNWHGAPVLFQAIIFSLVLAYMALTIYEWGSYKYAKNFIIYIMLNPATLALYMTSPKDNSFAIALLLLMTFATRIYFTNGEWLKSAPRCLIFIILLVCGTLFRHNGILFTLPLLFAVSLYIRKSKALLILICFWGLIYAVRYPLYDTLNVERPGSRRIETLGIPISTIGNAAKESPEKLDKDILEFAYSIAPQEVWRDKFNIINGFISVKYAANERSRNQSEKEFLSKSIKIYEIENMGWLKVLDMTLRCFKEAPWASLRGFLGPTSLVYSIGGPPLGRIVPSIAPNGIGLKDNKFFKLNFVRNILNSIMNFSGSNDYKSATGGTAFRLSGYENDSGDFTLQSLIILIYYAIMVLFKHIFWCIGVLNLVIIIFILARLNFSVLNDWKRFFLSLPILCHNFGTMLLLSGNDFRYFYATYLVIPLILLILLRYNGSKISNSEERI